MLAVVVGLGSKVSRTGSEVGVRVIEGTAVVVGGIRRRIGVALCVGQSGILQEIASKIGIGVVVGPPVGVLVVLGFRDPPGLVRFVA